MDSVGKAIEKVTNGLKVKEVNIVIHNKDVEEEVETFQKDIDEVVSWLMVIGASIDGHLVVEEVRQVGMGLVHKAIGITVRWLSIIMVILHKRVRAVSEDSLLWFLEILIRPYVRCMKGPPLLIGLVVIDEEGRCQVFVKKVGLAGMENL